MTSCIFATIVEPETAGRYRQTPVTFHSGGASVTASAVPSATARLFAYFKEGDSPDELVHSFLKIHPLEDGNGRIAFLFVQLGAQVLGRPGPTARVRVGLAQRQSQGQRGLGTTQPPRLRPRTVSSSFE